MIKRLCDICEQPAIESVRLEVSETFGEEYQNKLFGVEPEKRQRSVTLRPVFGIRNDPSGFGGPPDLCWACVCRLLEKLLSEAQQASRLLDSVNINKGAS